jgi:hypothetical protein
LPLNSFQKSELLAFSHGERPTVVIAMLTEIKGVSKSLAALIAANFTIAKLCVRDTLTTEAIADLKTNAAGRRIGSKLAERISETWSDEAPANFQLPVTPIVTAMIPQTVTTTPQLSDLLAPSTQAEIAATTSATTVLAAQ